VTIHDWIDAAIAVGVIWIAAELRDLRKDVSEIWKRMRRID